MQNTKAFRVVLASGKPFDALAQETPEARIDAAERDCDRRRRSFAKCGGILPMELVCARYGTAIGSLSTLSRICPRCVIPS